MARTGSPTTTKSRSAAPGSSRADVPPRAPPRRFEVNRASTTLLALVLFPGGLVYAALGALGKTMKPVEIAVGLAAVIFGIFGLIGGGYWYKQMDVDDDTFDDDDKGWTRSPCTAGCELELFVGATAVFTGIGVVCATARGGETRGKAESSGWGAAYVERGSGAV